MGRLLDRTPLPILVLIGCLLGAVCGLLDLISPAAFNALLNGLAIPAIVGFVGAWIVALLRGLYQLAFDQPQRTLPGRHPIVHLLLGLAYVSMAMLALDIVGILLGLLPPQSHLPSPSELLYTWLLRGWLISTVEVIPILVLMRLLAKPWQRLRAWLMLRLVVWWSRLRPSRSQASAPAAPGSSAR